MSKELKNLANKNLSFPVPSGEFKIRRIITTISTQNVEDVMPVVRFRRRICGLVKESRPINSANRIR